MLEIEMASFREALRLALHVEFSHCQINVENKVQKDI